MNLVRTSLRLEQPLKKAAEAFALSENITLQQVMNDSLREFLKKKSHRKAREIVFEAQDVGVNIDNLTREDYYADR